MEAGEVNGKSRLDDFLKRFAEQGATPQTAAAPQTTTGEWIDRTPLKSVANALADRSLAAMEQVWRCVLEVRELTSPLLYPYQLLTPEDYEKVYTNARLTAYVSALTDEELSARASDVFAQAEQHRLYLSDAAWLSFHVYYIFAMRTASKVLAGRAKKEFPRWNVEAGKEEKLRYLKQVFATEEFAAIVTNHPLGDMGAPQRILQTIEAKLLLEMNIQMFGRSERRYTAQDSEG